jgi:hypothetical protein
MQAPPQMRTRRSRKAFQAFFRDSRKEDCTTSSNLRLASERSMMTDRGVDIEVIIPANADARGLAA